MAEHPDDALTLTDVIRALEGRALPILILLLALPNIVGVGAIPGVSTLFGVPQMLFAFQMIMGRREPWLPARARQLVIQRQDLQRLMLRAGPWLQRIERRLRPRLSALATPGAERLLGTLLLILATVVALPIPGANNLPSVAMAVISLGLVAFDGACVAAGVGVGMVSLAVAAAVVGGAVVAAQAVWAHLFG